ncbi:porin family protein [Bacteroides sedimenti]|uniref:Outer membrane protein beta-barrel domain-containing protein n=1 Tax=Bacteroides sedimenti TaxID=2136147 RepID=A0ABM8IEF6_9BACE
MGKIKLRQILTILFLYLMTVGVNAQTRRVQYRPYIDQRKVHYGFLIGLHTQDLEFINNGYITENGESWFADVPSYNPGFTVGVLGELYLNKNLALRAIPTLHFGDKTVVFREQKSLKEERQQIKSTYLSLPLDLKFSAERFNNYRPYIMTGINPMIDLSVKKNQELLVKRADCYLEAGVGCDFYLPFFKLIPELKFCFGLNNLLQKNRTDLNDKSLLKYTYSVDKMSSRMIVFSLYFE